MSDIRELIVGLIDPDDKKAYACFLRLKDKSTKSSAVYPYLDALIEMLCSKKTYIRSRGLLLIASNAQWDVDHTIDRIIDKLLKCITDEKPIIARQCIGALPTIARYKPSLKACILNALRDADLSIYQESMRSLISKDIQRALSEMSD